MIAWLGIALLFVVGIRLSFFFSGIETAFYRASKLRLNIDGQTGDQLSRNILAFVSRPSSFVATILIGNNIANYVTTAAISSGAILALGAVSELTEVGVTVLLSPVVFVIGELLPKTLHYQAPLLMLKRYFWFFRLIHLLLLPLSWPLMLLTSLLQKLGGSPQEPMLRILGRRPLANVIGQGHEEGVVSSMQHDLIQGVFLNANIPILKLITPREIAFLQLENPTRAQLLKQARELGLVEVAVLEDAVSNQTTDVASDQHEPAKQVGVYYRVAELLIDRSGLSELRLEMPEIPIGFSRLEALLELQQQDADLGAVVDGGKIVGTIRRRILMETLIQGGLGTSSATVA